MTNFYDTTIRNSGVFRSDNVCKDVNLLEPGTRAAVLALQAEAHEEGHDLRILETYRSQHRQSTLYVRRLTQLRIVGCHGYGVAADFGLFIDDRYVEHDEPYHFLAELARKHGLVSGLDWGHDRPIHGFIDSGHVQRVPIFRQHALLSDAWYPPAEYDPYEDMKSNGVE